MQVFEVTGRATKREKYNTVWRCGVPWPIGTADKRSITHQLRLFTRDELLQYEPVTDDCGKPVVDKDGKTSMRIKRDAGTGAPVRRKLCWCLREDGSRVAECYADTFELAKTDMLIDIVSIKEVDAASVPSIANCKLGDLYEDVTSPRPMRSALKK